MNDRGVTLAISTFGAFTSACHVGMTGMTWVFGWLPTFPGEVSESVSFFLPNAAKVLGSDLHYEMHFLLAYKTQNAYQLISLQHDGYQMLN